jgi:hypothetical protein
MALDEVLGQVWTRKHDDVATPVVPSAPRTVFVHSLEDCIEVCRTRQPHERIRAAGSHWALSQAAIADTVFVETHEPIAAHAAMDRTIYEVIPGCLTPAFEQELAARHPMAFSGPQGNAPDQIYPVHIETGKRVHQAYSELDFGDTVPESLATRLRDVYRNPDYLGPWGFRTLGGAGGQTVFGALHTGTHGGDFELPPIADSVMAIHLVADGGMHHWIEPERPKAFGQRMTDRDALIAVYGAARYGGPRNFEVHYDDELFNAVLISAGRFGIVYSIVLAAVPQYCLHQERRVIRDDGSAIAWEDIKTLIRDPTSELYRGIIDPMRTGGTNKFLQVAVSLTPHANFTRHLAGITKRWNCDLVNDTDPANPQPAGRRARRGDLVGPGPVVVNGHLAAPTFSNSGTEFAYAPDPSVPGAALPPNFLERACTNGDFVSGVVSVVMREVQDFVDTNGAAIGATMAAVGVAAAVAPGIVLPLLALLAALAILLLALAALLAAFASAATDRFGEVMNGVRSTLLDRSDPDERMAGLFVWQMIVFEVFKDQQKNQNISAISYAAMDGHDYRDRSCNFNVDSIEVFFDVTDPMLVAFVDAILAFEQAQEVMSGAAFVGYASLRFMAPTQALIGMQRRRRPGFAPSEIVCAIEVAGLRDVRGTTELIDFALTVANNPNFQGVLHWGQRHTATRPVTERLFGDSASRPGLALGSWRRALSRLTANGRLDGFSSAFSRRAGLEIVVPITWQFSARGTRRGQPIDVLWECKDNPAATLASLLLISPSGSRAPQVGLPLAGNLSFTANETGIWRVVLELELGAGAIRRTANQERTVFVM